MNYLDQTNILPCAIKFSSIPPTSDATNKPISPFTISITANDTNTHIVDLYAQYSQSHVYQNPQQKWSHLIPQWRFLDLDGNMITSIATTDTLIYSGTAVIGVTGEASFDYIDDMGCTTGTPIILWATMQVSGIPLSAESAISDIPSYANSKVVTYVPFYINQLTPTELHITRNGIDEMSITPYWVNKNIPTITTLHGKPLTLPCLQNSKIGTNMIYTYPATNAIGYAAGAINQSINTIPTSSQNWTSLGDITTAAYFQAYDAQGLDIRGYSRSKVVANVETLNTTITAGISLQQTNTFVDTPFVWISHPNSHLMYKIYAPYISSTIINNITSWLQEQSYVQTLIFDTPYITEKIDTMSLTGFGGIYGIAVDPCYNIWCSDSEMDKLYKFDYNGILLSTINLGDNGLLSSIGVSGGCTPAGLSLDSTNGLWVSLFDSISVLKINRTTGELITAINPYGNQTSPIGGFGIDPDFKPTLAETDKNDNVWVSYTNSLCSYLNKYDSLGTPLLTITLPTCSNPMDMLVDSNNNIWATLTHHSGPPYLSGSIICVAGTNGATLSTINMTHPEYLTMDKDANIWVTYGFNKVNKITPNGLATSFNIGTSTQPTWYNSNSTLEFNCLEGIACDSSNRIWVINSYESKAYVLSGNQIIQTYTLTPYTSDWYLDTNLNIISLSSQWTKSIQAFGDWTGMRWLQKYANVTSLSTVTTYISGTSDVFNINTFSNYDVRKFNESWDATNQIRNYALPEHFYNDSKLFVDYIGTMIGSLETSANSIGRLIYERIANYVANHEDVETANIPQLYGLAQKINSPIDDYNFKYPADLKRIMDIVSIPHKTLWGGRCQCNLNFKQEFNYCANCGHRHASNIGNPIDTDTYVTTADKGFLAEYVRQKGSYELIMPLNNGETVFEAASAFLINDVVDYCYFEHIPTYCGVQNEGVISWDDEYTTLNETSSGLEEWYGNGGIVEKMLTYYIHEGLGF